MTSPNSNQQAESQLSENTPAPAILPGTNGRMAIMVSLALIALALSIRPDIAGNTTQIVVPEPAETSAAVSSGNAATFTAPIEAVPDTLPMSEEQPESSIPVEPIADQPANEASEPEPEAPKEEVTAPVIVDDGPGFRDDFAASSGDWVPMTGSWEVAGGALVQADAQGFDYIMQLTKEVPDRFNVSVRMEALSDELGGGLVLGQPELGSRRGSYIVDFTAGGSFLRWGRYDPETGAYGYIGGLNVGADPGDPQNLRVAAQGESTLVYLNDVYIGAFDAIEPGTVGLATSQSSVSFDDFVVEEA